MPREVVKNSEESAVICVELTEWSCSNYHSVFYTYERDQALCPECGVQASKCGKLKLVLRNGAFEGLIDNVIKQACGEGCWVYQDGVTEANVKEVEAVVGECPIAALRRALYGDGCPVRDPGGE